jgi:hypothetical protein
MSTLQNIVQKLNIYIGIQVDRCCNRNPVFRRHKEIRKVSYMSMKSLWTILAAFGFLEKDPMKKSKFSKFYIRFASCVTYVEYHWSRASHPFGYNANILIFIKVYMLSECQLDPVVKKN